MKKKVLAIALAAFMVLGLVPGLPMQTARAASFTVTDEAGLIAAIDSAATNEVITVDADITLTADLTINKSVALVSSGAKIIAGSKKIIIAAGSYVDFCGALSITGNAPTGFEDGLVVVEGELTIQPNNVSITNSYTGSGNSAAVYVHNGRLNLYDGSISDTASGGSNASDGILVNGADAYVSFTNGSTCSVSGSNNGIASRGGADLAIRSGSSISGKYGVFFYGNDGGTFRMTGGTVSGTSAGIRVTGSTPAQDSRVTGGTIAASNGCGVAVEDFSDLLVTGCTITGSGTGPTGKGGIFVETGSTLRLERNSSLSVTGGVRVDNASTFVGIPYLTALPAAVSAEKDGSVSFSLTGAETTFAIDGTTTASLNATLSTDTHTITLSPTAAGTQTLVLTSAVDMHNDDYGGDYSNTLILTIPVTVTDPTTVRGTWLDDPANYDTDWYDEGEDAFIITNAEELAGFAKLTGDGNDFSGKTVIVNAPGGIDLSAHDWVPCYVFSGTFDGGNDVISGLTIGTMTDPETAYTDGVVGLFGHVYSGALKNIRLDNVEICADASLIGGLAGEIYNCVLTNCSIDGDVSGYGTSIRDVGGLGGFAGKSTFDGCTSSGNVRAFYTESEINAAYVGGLCGLIGIQSALSDCHNSASVRVEQFTAYAGGISGLIDESSLENCSNRGDISNIGDLSAGTENNDHYLGGIAGVFRGSMQRCYNTGAVHGSGLLVFCGGISAIMNLLDTNSIRNSYNTGGVSAEGEETYSGGIVSILNEDSGTLENCFNIGMVTGTSSGTAYIGGIISNDLHGALTACYYLQGAVSGDGGSNAMAKTVADFHESGTFTGWDFDSVWQFAAGMNRYPTLRGNAQTNGYVYPLSFHITDAHDDAIAGAAVTLKLNGKTFSYPNSNAAGYSSASVSAGNYSYTARKSGYTDFTGTVSMSENTSATIPVTMLSGGPTATTPTVVTNAASGVTASGATLNGEVTASGGATVTARGFAYATSANPTTTDSTATAGGGTGTFTANISGLTAGTTYHVRAYATNSEGTSYGADVTFTTTAAPTAPTVTAVSPSSGPEAGGTSVTITGTNFTGSTAVKFGGSAATYTVNSATQIIAVAPAGTGTVHITVATADGTSATSSADRFIYTSGGGGGGGGTAKPTTYTADVQQGGVKTDTLTVTASGSTGTASLIAAKAAMLFSAGNASVVMPAIPGVSAYTLELPASALDARYKGGALSLSTGFGSVTIPDNMLGSLTGTDGKTAGITVARGDTSGLTDAEKTAIGGRPVIQLTLTLGGAKTEWNNPGAPVTVNILYTPTAEELKNPESILIWYLDGSGKPVCVPNGHYDAATGTVTFTGSHFSRYAVGYNPVSFKDVSSGAWYHGAVSFIAARGITTGTGNGNFSPDAKLTRGEFIVLLMRAYGIAPDAALTDNFADAGSTYYTNYLAAAKRLGISAGVGGNMFAPGKEITRQEMFALLYNALKVINSLPQGSSGRTLSNFADAGQIATWAKDAMTLLVETGTISGSGGKLNPTDTTTRAEMAQVLYNLLIK